MIICKIYKGKIKSFLKIIVFLVLFLGFLYLLEWTMNKPLSTYWPISQGMNDCRNHKNKYDVVFVGSSVMVANINCQELYRNYGISSVSVAEPSQVPFLSLAVIEEVMKYQCPKVLVLDLKIFLYDEDKITNMLNNESQWILHGSLDSIGNASVKKKALDTASNYMKIDYLEFYSSIYRTHNNWKSISKNNFTKINQDFQNGNLMIDSIMENANNELYENSILLDKSMCEQSEEIIGNILDLCKKNNTQLILTNSYITEKENHVAASKIAEKYNLVLLDINEVADEIGFINSTDCSDYGHFNFWGTIKWSDYIGQYLVANCSLPDIRNEMAYNWYQKQDEKYLKKKDYILSKLSLQIANNFDGYLQSIDRLDNKRYTIFMSICIEGARCINENEQKLMSNIGIRNNLVGEYGASFVAVISNGETKEEFSNGNIVKFSGVLYNDKMEEISYEIVSGGSAGEYAGSFLINNKEYMPFERGFHILVWDNENSEVISQAYFDTYEEENPLKRRVVKSEIKVVEEQGSDNIWRQVCEED